MEHGELRKLEAANVRLLGEVRVLVAIAAMAIALADPALSASPVLAVLLPYGAFSAAVMLHANRHPCGAALRGMYRVDAACYLLAIALSGGIESKLVVALLFPILVVSFKHGFRRGAVMAGMCAALFALVGAAAGGLDRAPDPDGGSLLPVVALFLVGLIVARWGNTEYTVLRRLAFTTDVNGLATPRYGLPHAMGRLAQMLRAYLRADNCIVVLNDADSPGCLLYDAREQGGAAAARGERIGREHAAPLLALNPELAAICSAPYGLRGGTASAFDRTTLEARPCDRATLDGVAALLETDSFVTLPLYSRERPIGRLYATSQRFRYTKDDLRFLQQAIGHAALVIDAIVLVERLADEKARAERERISRDLHDGTIQPYIGLKLGLEALRRQMSDADALAAEVDDLRHMAEEGIAELRRYVAGLRGAGTKGDAESLLVAVRHQADKFSEYYGIKVDVNADSDVQLKQPLAEHVLNIVREGLANIRRHTDATRATVRFCEEKGRLLLEFLNERTAGQAREFFPRSLNERASDLGGHVRVEDGADGVTRVAVEIPI